ncbi:MAG: SCO6880 family protein [Nocardioides sp.]|uniref:SCO6880 family protein n=1 Tax=Nocardioides sp. TaxID=35761 RepID=UPI003266D195
MTAYGASATRDRHGWFLGLTGPQVFLVLGAAFPCWLAMAAGQWGTLLVLGPMWLLAVVLICVPVRGWSTAQWIGVLVRHAIGRIAGWTSFQSKAAAGEIEDPGEADLPGVLAGIEIHDGPPMTGRVSRPAIIQNHTTRTWGATARIVHPGIGMADDEDRNRMGAGLAELFEAATASNQVDLVAICVRTVPDDGTERADWVRHHARQTEPEISARIHGQLDAAIHTAAVRTEAFVTVVVREETIAKDARRAGRGLRGRARILYGILGEVESRLTGAIGCTQVDWMDSSALAIAIRTGFEPGDAPALADSKIHHEYDEAIAAGVPVAAVGPTNAATAMRTYRHGEWESIATTVLLPRKGAFMGALARALVPSQVGERRALTVFYRPIGQVVADRTTGRAEMSATMAAEVRRKVGRVERARERRAVEQIHETDEKLDRGRSLVRVSSALAITVPATWNAQDYGRRLDASVRLCGFTPLPLDGAHDAAFAAAVVPLGTGLPKKRRS